jgi:hypothetical protein
MNKEAETLEDKALLIKIAIDMHLRSYRVVGQIDRSRSRHRSLRRQPFTPGWKNNGIWERGWWFAMSYPNVYG